MYNLTRNKEHLYSSMRFQGDGRAVRVPLTFDLREGDGLAVDLGRGLVNNYKLDDSVTPKVLVFDEPLPKGETITIRRLTYIEKVPHIFQWLGNAQGGADFSAVNIDENFEQITRASQDAMDAQVLASLTLEEMAGIRDDAEDASARSKQSAKEAKAAESGATTKAIEAGLSAKEAKSSEDAAAKSKEEVDALYQQTLTASQEVKAAKDVAEASAKGAKSSESAANSSATLAKSSSDAASASANSAEASSKQSKESEQVAAASAAASKQSAYESQQHSNASKSYADGAKSYHGLIQPMWEDVRRLTPEVKQSAAEASSSAHAAANSQNSAAASEEAAKDSEQRASSLAAAASSSAQRAAGSANSAAASASTANTKSSEASRSATDAKGSEDLAKKWAVNPVDLPVQGSEYSAYHWAMKAKDFSGIDLSIYATNSRVDGVSDRVTTAQSKADSAHNIASAAIPNSKKVSTLGTSTDLVATQKLVNDVSIRTTTAQNRADSAYSLANLKQDKLTFAGTGDVVRKSVTDNLQSTKRDKTDCNFDDVAYFASKRSDGTVFLSSNVEGTDFNILHLTSGESALKRGKRDGGVLTNTIPDVSGTFAMQEWVKEMNFGAGQRWYDVTSERTDSIAYKNTTDRTIFIAIHRDRIQIAIDDIIIGGASYFNNCFFPITPGSTYKMMGGDGLKKFMELK